MVYITMVGENAGQQQCLEFDMRELTKKELGQVSGAGKPSYDCPPSAKQKGNNGFGNGGFDGVPGNSGKQDKTR